MEITLNGNPACLLFQKAVFFPEKSWLVIADLHLGKVAHFRREGIAMPAVAQQEDYARLYRLIDEVAPQRIIFLGDLFHSSLNDDWINFAGLITNYPRITFTLVRGNHDLIHQGLYKELDVFVTDCIEADGLLFTHQPEDTVQSRLVNIAGHIHPGFTIYGIGRQSAKLPCFYYSSHQLILPAFGGLTGLFAMPAEHGADIYLVLSDEVRKWKGKN